jgi:hypothetical protein
MAQLHAVGASIVLGAVLVTGLLAIFAALQGGSPWTDRLHGGLTVVIGLQVAGGVTLYVSGARPNESLHLLYGLAVMAILPLASTFAAEGPPRPRAWLLVASCAILLALAWRLASTG